MHRSHSRHTFKPGMFPKKLSVKSAEAEKLREMEHEEWIRPGPEAAKHEKLFHNRKSRHYLNVNVVNEGLEEYYET